MNTTRSYFRALTAIAVALAMTLNIDAQKEDKAMEQQVVYRTVKVDRRSIFYREAGLKDAPTVLFEKRRGALRNRKLRAKRPIAGMLRQNACGRPREADSA